MSRTEERLVTWTVIAAVACAVGIAAILAGDDSRRVMPATEVKGASRPMDRGAAGGLGVCSLGLVIAETKYTRLGTQSIAWQVIGDGPTDFVWNVGRIGSMEGEWADPEATSMLLRIASFCRMIRYDSLGTGSSDPVPLDSLPPLEASVDELMTVMDAAQSERAVLFGGADNGPAVLLAAASRPERVLGLVLFTAAGPRVGG